MDIARRIIITNMLILLLVLLTSSGHNVIYLIMYLMQFIFLHVGAQFGTGRKEPPIQL